MNRIWNGQKKFPLPPPTSEVEVHLLHVSAGGSGDSGQGWEERFSGISASSMSLFQLKTKYVPCLNKLEYITFVSGVKGFLVVLILVLIFPSGV